MIDVTAAIIHKNDRIFVCQRPKGKRCEFLWEFPGGKIEAGETPEKCIFRECREELNIIIKPEKLVSIVTHEYPDITVKVHFYICELVDGEPICIEHEDIQWLTLDEIFKLPLCPADKKMLDNVASMIQKILCI